MSGRTVLDASAIMAYLQDERGSSHVEAVIGSGAIISAVNWAEVLSAYAQAGSDPVDLHQALESGGLIGEHVVLAPLEPHEAPLIASLRPLTRARGLSLADRTCLALAIRLDRPVLTADRSWAELRIGVEVRLLRD